MPEELYDESILSDNQKVVEIEEKSSKPQKGKRRRRRIATKKIVDFHMT